MNIAETIQARDTGLLLQHANIYGEAVEAEIPARFRLFSPAHPSRHAVGLVERGDRH
jgi:hypothetical protein